jgi:hypothetical protein
MNRCIRTLFALSALFIFPLVLTTGCGPEVNTKLKDDDRSGAVLEEETEVDMDKIKKGPA